MLPVRWQCSSSAKTVNAGKVVENYGSSLGSVSNLCKSRSRFRWWMAAITPRKSRGTGRPNNRAMAFRTRLETPSSRRERTSSTMNCAMGFSNMDPVHDGAVQPTNKGGKSLSPSKSGRCLKLFPPFCGLGRGFRLVGDSKPIRPTLVRFGKPDISGGPP